MITIEKCWCGDDGCGDYWLKGIGKFVQGSGFTREEAQRIADLLNSEPPSPEPATGEHTIPADATRYVVWCRLCGAYEGTQGGNEPCPTSANGDHDYTEMDEVLP